MGKKKFFFDKVAQNDKKKYFGKLGGSFFLPHAVCLGLFPSGDKQTKYYKITAQ